MLCASAASRSHSLRLEVRAGPSGHVVDADRQGVDGFGEGEEVLKLALLRWLIVIGICRQDGAEALDPLQKAGLSDQRFGAIVRAAAPDWDAPGSRLDDDANGVEPLVFFESGGLAG